jgi:hypothetical protein
LLKFYRLKGKLAMTDKTKEISQHLFQPGEYCGQYPENEKYQAHILEQYKIYIEMADRVSARRQAANSYFLAINTAIIGFIGYTIPKESTRYLWILSAGGMAICYFWYRIIISYKQLNAGKFNIIHMIETHLPIRPYNAEWVILGEGKCATLYKPVTHVENTVPWIFFTLHLMSIFR